MRSASQQRSPYQGLIPYEEDDAPFFFGREKETRLIAANLFAAPLTLLYGSSGVGKSSVLRAGVINHLRPRDDLLVVEFHAWQSDPIGELKAAIAVAAVRANGQGAPPAASASLAECLVTYAAQLDRRLMIILDQFEEYFLYHPLDDAFAAELPNAVMQADAPVSFLISIREDALAKLDRFEGRIPILFDNYLRIEHLAREAARRAIEEPIQRYNRLRAADEPQVSIEPKLVEAVLGQVKTGQVILGEAGRGVVKGQAAEVRIETPYLQLVMTRLWDEEMRVGRPTLRLETLQRLGGAERIVKTHLDAAMSTLPPEEQDVAARAFHYLVTPSGTKIAHTIPDLAEYTRLAQTQLSPVLETLSRGNARILRPVPPPPDQPDKSCYEIFHDKLAPALLDWRARYLEAQKLTRVEYRLIVLSATAVFGALLGALFTAPIRMVPGFSGCTLTQSPHWVESGTIGLKLMNGVFGFFQGGVGGLIWGGSIAGVMALGWIRSRHYGRRLITGWNAWDVLRGASGGLIGGIVIALSIFFMFGGELEIMGWLPKDWLQRCGGDNGCFLRLCIAKTKYCLIHPLFGIALGAGIALSIEGFYSLPRSFPGWDGFIEPHDKAGRLVCSWATLRQMLSFSALFSIPTAVLLCGTAIALKFWLELDWGRTLGEVTSIIAGGTGVVAGIMLGQLITRVGIPVSPPSDQNHG